MTDDTRPIHPAWLRATHWLNAVAVVVLAMSGWRIYNAAPFFDFTIPREITLGGWLGGAIQWHFAAMWLLAANGRLFAVTLEGQILAFGSEATQPSSLKPETADIAAGDLLFRATGSRVEFMGCLAAQGRSEEDDHPLPALEPGQVLVLVKIEPQQHFTKPPPRFTDASLVKALEEKGIGRPSTYAPTIQTITTRDYVRREGGSLVPTELGILVTDLLVQYFSKLLDYEFTANMENELDDVEEGKLKWVQVVRRFYGVFSKQLEFAKSRMQSVKREAEPTDEVCEKCGKPMVIKWGRRGRFMSCSAWPECKNAKSISTDVVCPQCGQGKLVARRARSGRGRPFYGCTRYPDCNFITNRLPKAEGETPVKADA